MRLLSRPHAIPDEHVLAAGQIHAFAGKNAHKIAAIRVNGVTIDNPVAQAAALRADYAAEKARPKGRWEALDEKALDKAEWCVRWVHRRVVKPVLRKFAPLLRGAKALGQWSLRWVVKPVWRGLRPVVRGLAYVARPITRPLAALKDRAMVRLNQRLAPYLLPRPALMVEAVYGRAKIEVDTTDGRTLEVNSAPILKTAATLAIVKLTALANAGASAIPAPALGTIPLAAGAVAALGFGAFKLATGRVKQALGYARSIVKLGALACCDCISGLSTATIYPSFFNALSNYQQLQKGEMLVISMRHCEPLLAGLAATGLPIDEPPAAPAPQVPIAAPGTAAT